jgi:hypothetical protein
MQPRRLSTTSSGVVFAVRFFLLVAVAIAAEALDWVDDPAKIYDFAGLVFAVVIGYIGGESASKCRAPSQEPGSFAAASSVTVSPAWRSDQSIARSDLFPAGRTREVRRRVDNQPSCPVLPGRDGVTQWGRSSLLLL